jgi:ribosomal protein L37E
MLVSGLLLRGPKPRKCPKKSYTLSAVACSGFFFTAPEKDRDKNTETEKKKDRRKEGR